MKRMAAILASGVLAAAGIALAQDTTPQSTTRQDSTTTTQTTTTKSTTGQIPSLETLDTDRDGSVSSTEAAKSSDLASVFTQADVDKNGKLDELEYANAMKLSQHNQSEQDEYQQKQ